MTVRWTQESSPNVLKKSNEFSLPVLLQRCFMLKMVKEKLHIKQTNQNDHTHPPFPHHKKTPNGETQHATEPKVTSDY